MGLCAIEETGHYREVISPGQCRAARALLKITQQTLADRSGVGILAIKRFEQGISDPRRSTISALERVLFEAGVELIDPGVPSPTGGEGVRLRRGQ